MITNQVRAVFGVCPPPPGSLGWEGTQKLDGDNALIFTSTTSTHPRENLIMGVRPFLHHPSSYQPGKIKMPSHWASDASAVSDISKMAIAHAQNASYGPVDKNGSAQQAIIGTVNAVAI